MDKQRFLTRIRVRRFRAARAAFYSRTESQDVYGVASTSKSSNLTAPNFESDENESVNKDDQIINEEIENEREGNEIREVITRDISDGEDNNVITRDVSDSEDNNVIIRDVSDSEDNNVYNNEQNDDEYDEAWDDVAELRQWAIQSRIQHCHLDSLLRILRKRLIPNLPTTSKTFLKTKLANNYQIKEFRSNDGAIIGEFIYFGIATGLRRCVNKKIHLTNTLQLQINCDGLPLYKSSSKQFWPILCKVHNIPDIYKPFPVAIFSGNEKPNNINSYLSDFIEEMNKLTREDIIIEEQIFKVRIMCFVCDRPARSFLKCIKGHGGYNACERCLVPGQRYQNRTIYVSTNCDKRTDESFRAQEDSEHHVGISPFLRLEPSIDMINQFVLDFMHQGCLGVMKKMMLDFWLDGNLATKISQHKKRLLSQSLVELQSQIPIDFQRTTRSITDISKWKATEYRLFLLYVGPVVLQQILEKRYYNHFLLLHAACRILNSDNLCLKYNFQAKVYLNNFVMLIKQYYNSQSLVMNVHSLTHLSDDVKNMKCSLSNYTAFPFENLLGKMKKMLRSGNRPLAQFCRRQHESFYAESNKVTLPQTVIILKTGLFEPCGRTPIKKIKYKETILTCKEPNNVVLLTNKKIIQIKKMYIPQNKKEEDIILTGNKLKTIEPMFMYPCNSGKLDIWQVVESKIEITCLLQSVNCKMVFLKSTIYENDDEENDNEEETKAFVMPLLHM